MARTQFRKTCNDCGEGIPLSSRICPFCNQITVEFLEHVSLCECGEHNVYSAMTLRCWNCGKDVSETFPPAGEWFCERCGDFATNMGGTVCTNCWDYFALRRAQERGVPESQISLFTQQGAPPDLERQSDCGVCAKRNESWRSFCISCGNYLVKRLETAEKKTSDGSGSGCMVVLAVLLLALGAGIAVAVMSLSGT
jgi:hypothetical protein